MPGMLRRQSELDGEEPPSAVLRRAIKESGLSLQELSRRTGVNVSALSRFVRESVGLSLASLDRLAPELKLRVVVAPKERT